MKWLVILFLLAGCGAKPSATGGGSVDIGNGGDVRVAEWTRIGFELVGLLREKPVPAISSERLEAAVRSTVVGTTEGLSLGGVTKDAINYPTRNPPAIVFDPKHWDGIRDHHEKLFLVLHEYLGIVGVDDTGYQASYQLDQAMVCRRTPAIRIAIENSLKRLCYQMSPPELRFVDKLELYSQGIRELKQFDFYYLTQLRSLDLTSNQLQAIPPGVFRDLGLLTKLDLRFNEIKEFAPGTFEGLVSMKSMPEDFYSPLTRVGSNFLGNITQLNALSLCPKSGELTEIAPGALGGTKIYGLALCFNFTNFVSDQAFNGMENLYQLHLAGRGVNQFPAGIFIRMQELEILHLKVDSLWVRNDQIVEWNMMGNLRTIVLETLDRDPVDLARQLTAYGCVRGSNRYETSMSVTEKPYIFCTRHGAGGARHPMQNRNEWKGDPPRATVIVDPDAEVITAP